MAGQIVLTAASSGTVTLTPADTANAFVSTIPSRTGNLSIDGPTFSAYQSSTQTLSGATWTKIQFQTEEWDTANCFDSTTNYRFTPNVAGYYSVTGKIQPNASYSAGGVAVYKNGSIYKYGDYNLNSTGVAPPAMTCLVYLNGTTDYVELWGLLQTGQALVVASNMTYFQAAMVRAA